MDIVMLILLLALLGVFLFLFVWMMVRTLRNAGRSGWWCLLMFIPLVNVVAIWAFAFVRWPALDEGGGGEAAPEAPATPVEA